MTSPDQDPPDHLNDRLLWLARGFERLVIVALFGALAGIVVFALIRLGIGLFEMTAIPGRMTETHAVQRLFGMVMTVLIAMELGNSIMRHLREHEVIIQSREIILIGMMAIVRKIMLVDLSQQEPLTFVWLGLATLLLAVAFWLMGPKDRAA